MLQEQIYQGIGANYNEGRNIVLKGKATIGSSNFTGNISANEWTCKGAQSINGSLYTSGSIQIPAGCELDVDDYSQSSGTLDIGKNAALKSSGNYINGGTVTSAGIISVSDDSKITGAHTGGTFKAKGNVDASAALKPDVLKFESKLSQSFYNSAATQTERLEINNTSSGGFYVNSIINVAQKFDNKCRKLNNASNIRLNSDVLDKNVLDYDVCTDGEFKVSAGEEIYIKGNLILKSGARVIVEDGGKLTVKKHVSSQSSSFDIDKGGCMQINDYISSSSDTFEVDGSLIIRGDAKMSSASVSGTGLITFRGDLNVNSGIWDKPNIAFDSKVHQSVGGSTINVNDLLISNSAKSGISFSSGINCYGELTENYLKISGGSYIVKK